MTATSQPEHADDLQAKRLLLHADDLGLSAAVTDGILRGFSDGLLTSTSLMANGPAAEVALAAWPTLQEQQIRGQLPSTAAREQLSDVRRPFDLGIHLNLTQGYPLTGSNYPDELRVRDGRFCGVGQAFQRLYRRRHRFVEAIQAELSQQIEFMLDHGHTPTHLNGHQYVELLPGLADIVPQLLDRYSIPVVRVAREPGLVPLRLFDIGEVASWSVGRIKWLFALASCWRLMRQQRSFPGACFGTCHAGRIGLFELQQFLRTRGLPSVVEIVLHPGSSERANAASQTDAWFDPLAEGRVRELELLQSDELLDELVAYEWKLGRMSDLMASRSETASWTGSVIVEAAA
ncbi:ChbG/HpnK family deacetylase [bacterium]|nr:ChbG/HpnK family deacetylase [bacterium]